MENRANAQWYAEITMGKQDYERYDAILRRADELALELKPPQINPRAIPAYNAILRQLYGNLRPVLADQYRKQVDDFYKELQKQLEKFSSESNKRNQKVLKVDVDLILNLEKMHFLLLEIKQIVGLGINISKKEALKDKMKRALLGLNI